MRTFCFSPFAADSCFFTFATSFLFGLAVFGADHYRTSRTPCTSESWFGPLRTHGNIFYIGENVLYVHMVLFSLARSIHPLDQDFLFFRGMFYTTKQLLLEKILHVRRALLLITTVCTYICMYSMYLCTYACACVLCVCSREISYCFKYIIIHKSLYTIAV